MALPLRKIINKFYHKKSPVNSLEDTHSQRLRIFIKYLLLVLILTKVALLWYYYNTFVSMRFDIDESAAQIDTQLQRRKNILLNLTIMVKDYAKHEKTIFSDIAEIRTALTRYQKKVPTFKPGNKNSKNKKSKQLTASPTSTKKSAAVKIADAKKTKVLPPAPAGKNKTVAKPKLGAVSTREIPLLPGVKANFDPGAIFSKIFAIAERYPTLKLNENFKTFMGALVDSENKIATERTIYNKRVNDYSTVIAIFPGNIFAFYFGCKVPPFFKSENEAKLPPQVKY